jgi:hypothetical protein
MTKEVPSRDRMRDGSRLREVISPRQSPSGSTNSEPLPRSAFEAVTREMVRSLRDEVRDVKHRINQLITLIIGAILLEVLMRLIGVGL